MHYTNAPSALVVIEQAYLALLSLPKSSRFPYRCFEPVRSVSEAACHHGPGHRTSMLLTIGRRRSAIAFLACNLCAFIWRSPPPCSLEKQTSLQRGGNFEQPDQHYAGHQRIGLILLLSDAASTHAGRMGNSKLSQSSEIHLYLMVCSLQTTNACGPPG